MKKLLVKYKNVFVFLTFSIIIFLFFQSYISTREVIIDKNDLQQSLVEENVLESLKYAESSYEILEGHLEEEMKDYSEVMLGKYKENPDIFSWDLEELKKKFQKYELYIIGEDFKIVRTTFCEDLGLDFKQYPYFANLLKERLKGNIYYSDRLDISPVTGKVKKYSYMPTPDNKYLFELSVDISKYYPVMEELNAFSHADALVKDYDLIEEIQFYKFDEDSGEVGVVQRNGGIFLDTSIHEKDKKMV